MSLDDEARAELAALEAANLRRRPRVLAGRQGTRVVVDGVEVVSFASNDYLGLAGDARLARAAAAALETAGSGAGASRLIVGNHEQHVALERELADWLRTPAVRLFNTGYAANVGVLTALLRDGDVVFSDELDHASIVDGCRLSRAAIEIFTHRDLVDLERRLARTGRRRIIVSETVFSMDGDIADVRGLAALARRHDAALILDEAHALGVRGEQGRGVAAEAGVVPDVLIGTLGKAVGAFGAFAATTQAVSELLWNRARPLVFSTGLPPSVAAASRAGIEIVRGAEGTERRVRVADHARRFRQQMALGQGDVPIVPVVIGDDRRTDEIGRALFAEGVFVASVRPPTVPVGTARLRVSLSSDHTIEDIERVARTTQRVMDLGSDLLK